MYDLAPHESLQIHELLSFKNLCLTKSITMSPLLSDNELKSIMEQDISTTRKQIIELKSLIEQNSNYAFSPIS